MIINESSSSVGYRYIDQVYEPNQIINGILPSIRNIHPIILKVYNDRCNFDFSKEYTYITPKRNDDKFDGFMYCYKVQPIGPTFIGCDGASIDLCNDEVRKKILRSGINDTTIEYIANYYVDKYLTDKSNPSIVAHKCRVIERYRL